MLKRIVLTITIFLFITTNVSGQSGGFGAGVMIGEPTGISLKHWLSRTNALAGGLAWSLGKHDAFHLHGDYLWHDWDLIKVDKGKLPLYYGVGVRLLFADNAHFGIRGVLGLDYLLADIPLDIFLELAPVFDLAPSTEFRFNGGLGARYFF